MKTAKLIPINEYLSLKLEVDRLNQLVADLTDSLAKVNMQVPVNLDKGFLVTTKKGNLFIKISDIVMIKAESNYSLLCLKSGDTVLTSKTLKYWIDKCSVNYFIRTHKSFVINKNFITSFDSKNGIVELVNNYKATCSIEGRKMIMNLK